MFPSWRILYSLIWLLLSSSIAAYQTLSDDTLRQALPLPQESDFDVHNGPLLAPILIPRVPGTSGSITVQNHFADFFQSSLPDWQMSFHNSTSTTPVHGNQQVPFVNLIAYRDPPWAAPGSVGRLTLVAHYDSKYAPEGFIGATDSAAPCAMIMHAVRAIDAALTKKWNHMANSDDFDLDFDESKGIQVLFLDGEEAFHSWTDTDSLYGARALAQDWEQTMYPAASMYKNPLDSIELFVLLDLLGSPENTPIPSWQSGSHWSYVKMAELEQKFRGMGMFKSSPYQTWLPDRLKKNTDQFNGYAMLDDHIPFIERGVQVLHLIPAMFPSVWHTLNDDAAHLDIPTVLDWALLTSAFAAEYLELEGYFEPRPQQVMHEKRDGISGKSEL